jgi:hypothetical protein
MRRFAGFPFELTVGECGSVDGSISMLRRFESDGWLTLDVSEGWPMHHDWLDKWLQDCDTTYAVFVDSDVEFHGEGWLVDLVNTAEEAAAALVTAEFQPEIENFVHATTGQTMRLASRPELWVLLVDARQVAPIGTSFRSVIEPRPDLPEGAISYDTGALLYRDVVARGLVTTAMPPSFLEKATHFGGLTWKPLSGVRRSRRLDAYIRRRLLAYHTIWRRLPPMSSRVSR